MIEDLVGKILLGRYRVDALIGSGGMAEVYKVWDEERAAYLALKLLQEDIAQDIVFIRRFQREARTLEKLQHPNIVRFYGLEQEDLLAFILMDFVDGTSLELEISRNRGQSFSPERVSEIMRPVCSALHYAHRRGMVHCDIKPANIMIGHDDRVLVGDFGIARMTEAATATLVGAGTPAYMAPEQVVGKDPTPETDIYILGVDLFEMFTGGKRPFMGDQADTEGSTADKVRWEQLFLTPPSLRQYNPSISPELETVVLKCLQKEPDKRYQNTMQLLSDLENVSMGALTAFAVGTHSTQTIVDSSPPGFTHEQDGPATGGRLDATVGDRPITGPPVTSGPIEQDNKYENISGVGKKKSRRWLLWLGILLIVVLIVGGLVAGGGYLAYSMSRPQQITETVKAIYELETQVAAAMLKPESTSTHVNEAPSTPLVGVVSTSIPTEEISPTSIPVEATDAPEPTKILDLDLLMKSANILIFEDMIGQTNAVRYAKSALDRMGLPYVDVGSAKGLFQAELQSDGTGGEGWDLIIIAAENNENFSGEYFTDIGNALNNGTSIILETRGLDMAYTGKAGALLNRCGVEFERDWYIKGALGLVMYPLDSDHPILHEPNSIFSFTDVMGFWNYDEFGDVGDLIKVSPGSDAELLISSSSTDSKTHGTLAVCLDDRLILQTFSSHNLTYNAMLPLWENYIYNALRVRFEGGQ